jgi:hypothetical protein
MSKRIRLWTALLSIPILAGLSLPVRADHDHDRHDHDRHDHDRHDRDFHDRHEHHGFHGRDFRFFSAFELDLWRVGRWAHDWHDGRFGWWWIADGGWYWYPEPAYPYPTYVPPAPPLVLETPPLPPPAPVVVMPPPPPPALAAGAPPPQFWYYCGESRAYYPYVPTCSGPWRQVSATPPQSSR